MKSKLIGVTMFFALMIVGVTLYVYHMGKATKIEDNKKEAVVLSNEVEQLIKLGEYEKAKIKSQELETLIRTSDSQSRENRHIFIMCSVSLVFLFVVFLYVYFTILRPFEKLERYAGEIAKGNFEIPLNYERTNYFGKFTWAFDNMRREIVRARSCEKEAVENNKTVIATISHDIKTPIASIRAYAEGLEANMDTNQERRQRFLSVIMKKCDEVSKLTNDLFLHSLSDLEKLKVEEEVINLNEFVSEAVESITAGRFDVKFVASDKNVYIKGDKNRLMQVIENLINNSRKYAKTDIDISIEHSENTARICFRDYGPGILDEDMPFICDKFYRGRNTNDEQGSGLGLYIVKYLVEKMGGTVMLKNTTPGLMVLVSLECA